MGLKGRGRDEPSDVESEREALRRQRLEAAAELTSLKQAASKVATARNPVVRTADLTWGAATFDAASTRARFAVLLAVGVILSMFTAVSVTRALLGVVSGRGVKLSPGMMGVSKKSLRERQPQKAKAGVR